MTSSRQRKLLCLILLRRIRERRRRKHRFWIRDIFRRRKQKGEFNLFCEMYDQDHESFYHNFRMTPDKFDLLLTKIRPLIEKSQERREPISARERLAVTVRYLATGDAKQTISSSYRLGKTTVFNIINETCDAIWDIMGPEFLKTPSQPDEWRRISADFNTLWNFPNCLGALDGKHVLIEAPANSGTEYYNYKGTFSVVLLALCDAHYRFTMVDIGAFGRESDGGVFAQSKFRQALEYNTLQIPPPAAFPNSDFAAPYVVVADAAFPLRTWLLKPFPGRNVTMNEDVFNYRLCRARRIIENTFGILANRWRIFRRVISAKPDNVVRVVKAACVLHNFLQKTSSDDDELQYCPPTLVDAYDSNGDLIPGQWRDDDRQAAFANVRRLSGNRHSREAAEVRNVFANYFVSQAGEVAWQYRRVQSTGPSQ